VDFDLWADLLTVAAAAAVAAGLAWLSAALVARIGRKRDSSVLTIDSLCRTPWILTLTALAVQLTTLRLHSVAGGWRRLALIAVIAATCWLARRLLLVGEHILFRRLRMDVANNRRVRRARTQISLMRRAVVATVMLIGVAGGLMTFPDLRTFGGSLMASAGIAGIIAALAAQTMLGNVFAGLQLAFTDAVRIDDVVVVEEEWGWIEEITLTYVVVRIWDERRLVLPTSYFTTTPFQNWTRDQARLLGSVTLHLDYTTPLGPLREFTRAYLGQHPLWDRKDWVLQVVDTTESTMLVRVLASSGDSQSSWDLRCDVREAMLTFLRESHPYSLPVRRVMVPPSSAGTATLSLTSTPAPVNEESRARAGAPRHAIPAQRVVLPDATPEADLGQPPPRRSAHVAR
jgi:small-conductance mechanosensitive channel